MNTSFDDDIDTTDSSSSRCIARRSGLTPAIPSYAQSHALIADIAIGTVTDQPRCEHIADHPRGYRDSVSLFQLTIPFAMILMLSRLWDAAVIAVIGRVPERYRPYGILDPAHGRGKCTRSQAILALPTLTSQMTLRRRGGVITASCSTF